MKTIALTLFAAALAVAQSSSSATTAPAKDSDKAAPTAEKKKPAQASKASPAQKPKDQKAAQQKAPPKAEPPVQTIPAGATEVEPNIYRYTDSNGKTWNYRQTPFGINKWEQPSSSESKPAPPPVVQPDQPKKEPIMVTDLGDGSYRFDKKTPFGHSTWVRKKSELSDQEKGLIDGQQVPDARAVASKPVGN
jgi:hypothetical protein